jgi:predicted  nucleic acid-binding Zn-ribbon protein
MASGGERPDLDALRELDEVLRHFENELASWRRRALSAESRLADAGMGSAETPSRTRELEDENRALQERIAGAKSRVGELLDRMRFLEEQQHPGGNGQ